MSRVMFFRAVADMRRTTIWYAVGLIVYGALILAYFPTIRRDTSMIDQYIESFPEALIRAFGISNLGTLSGFLGAEFLNLIWPLIVAIFAIMAGASVVAHEVEQGTAEMWLSVPESRASLLLGKLAALLIGLVGLVVVTLATIIVGAAALGESVGAGNLLALGLVLLAFGIVVGGYAALFSSFSDERGRPAGMAAGVTLVFYLLWIVSGLSDSFGWLKYLSIFTAFQPQAALAGEPVPFLGVLIVIALGVICAGAAIAIFQRRDVFS